MTMADVLTHVLVGYILGTVFSFRSEWVRAPQVTLVMLGALSPDIVKIKLLLSAEMVELALGMPFSWRPLHTPTGSFLVVGLGALLVSAEHRNRVFVLLAVGAGSHHILDVLLINPSGYAYPLCWPLTDYRPPRGMLYLSSDRLPVLVAGTVAAIVWKVQKKIR
jgi:hypothetical protein